MAGRPKGTAKTGGRQKGTPNKATAELKELWGGFFRTDTYRDSASRRILDGKAPHLESYLLALIHGKPTERHELSDPDGLPLGPITFVLKCDGE